MILFAWTKGDAWIEAARGVNVMVHDRLGLVGYYYSAMLYLVSDIIRYCAALMGYMEAHELTARYSAVNAKQTSFLVTDFYKIFDIKSDRPSTEMEQVASASMTEENPMQGRALEAAKTNNRCRFSIDTWRFWQRMEPSSSCPLLCDRLRLRREMHRKTGNFDRNRNSEDIMGKTDVFSFFGLGRSELHLLKQSTMSVYRKCHP